VRALQAQGLGALIAQPPELSEAARRAVHCWSFSGGWNPAVWPFYDALYPVDDWHQLVDGMQAIRKAVDAERSKG
jgi:hypothetical protein